MGRDNNFEINASEDPAIFTYRNLKKYDVIIFLNTTGTILDKEQKMALKNTYKKGVDLWVYMLQQIVSTAGSGM